MARIPGICNHDPATTVLCHIRRPWNAGVGMKPDDLHGFFACSACHDEIDGRTNIIRGNLEDPNAPFATVYAAWLKTEAALDAHLRTLQWWKDNGYL